MSIEMVGKIATRHSDRIYALELGYKTVYHAPKHIFSTATHTKTWIVWAISSDFKCVSAFETTSHDEAAAMFKTLAAQLGLTQLCKDVAVRADTIGSMVAVINDKHEHSWKREGDGTWCVVVVVESLDFPIVVDYASSFKEATDMIAGYVAIINAGATKA